MRLIDADVLLEKVREIRKLALDRAVETPANMPFPIYQNPAYTRYSTQADEREKFKVMIEEAPSVQPEHKTGHWIAITSRNNTYKCSVCGRLLVNITDGKNKVAKNYPYCHCGADMRGGENDGCSQVFEREESDV